MKNSESKDEISNMYCGLYLTIKKTILFISILRIFFYVLFLSYVLLHTLPVMW